MRIKRVEIIGFKSFCDRAVVQIGESITGVVGPNGCGKSNIVDAIRWCMGEQSAKHLRGKAMEDVIFAGSETRGPAPMAEVSLTFDDVGFSHETLELARHSDEAETEKALETIGDDAAQAVEATPEVAAAEAGAPDATPETPQTSDTPETPEPPKAVFLDAEGQPIPSATEEVAEMLADQPPAFDFARYTEVTITRRLYRDGLSQYFINKSPCRLRDITDFFLGTGVGTKAYAIIEQGRIGQIVSSRPADRRAIIEEAAGITKFKAKKKAAEKKLDQTRQNLMRVSDIVGELDKRMGTLRRQAQKAERYRKYKTELRDIDLWKSAHRWLELSTEIGAVTGRLGEAREEEASARAEWTVKDAHVVSERAELGLEERRLVGVQELGYELDNRVRLGESKQAFERREADDLEARVAQSTREIGEIGEQRARGAEELEQRRAELGGLMGEVEREQSEVSEREALVGEARQMLANTQGRLDEARAEIGQRRTQIATADAQVEALGRRREETVRRMERVVGEFDTASERAKDLEREGKKAAGLLAELRQTRLDLGNQSESFAARHELLADETARGETEVEQLKNELGRKRSRLVSLKEIQERYEGFARGTRAVMARANEIAVPSDIHGVVADVVRAPERLEVAVEAVLGDRLGGVLVAEPAIGSAAIGFLKQHSGGRSAFVPVRIPVAAAAAADLATLAAASEDVLVPVAGLAQALAAPAATASGSDPAIALDGATEAAAATGSSPGIALDGATEAAANEAAANDAAANEAAANDAAANEAANDASASDAASPQTARAGSSPGIALDGATVAANEGATEAAHDAADLANAGATAPAPHDAALAAAADVSASRFPGEGNAETFVDVEATASPAVDAREAPAPAAAPILVDLSGREGVIGRMADLVDFADGYAAVGKRLFGATVVVDTLARALELRASGITDRIVTLEGDVVDVDGTSSGGSRDAQGAGVLAQMREIRELEEAVAALESRLAEAQAALHTAKAELKQVAKAIEGLRNQQHEGDLAIMSHEKDEARVRVELDRLRERLTHLGTERLELETRLAAIANDETAAREKKQAAEDRIAELERDQLDLAAELQEHRDRVEDLAQLLVEVRVRAAQLGEKRQAAEAAALRIEAADRDLHNRATRLTNEMTEATARAAELRADCERLAVELEEVRAQRSTAAHELETGRAAYDARNTALIEVELAARALRTRADELAKEVGTLELRLGQATMTRGNVEEGVMERYQLEMVDVIPEYHQRPQISETEDARLTELKELLDKMGTDINLTAIDEFAEVSKRFEFLSAQQADLERAVEQLQRAIDKINDTSRRLFRDTFAAVNKTFREVFPRLFRGGQAYLSLAPEKEGKGVSAPQIGPDGEIVPGTGGGKDKEIDLLEAGIEIFAQPPGKKNSTVELLSGGEKALTAVALVFSIFLIKPSPFCILDEVDAPLDEANVDRYNEIVREMTDRSQFIVISHNKRTMESADALYGVTMQEPGVSKLVSVNLTRIAQNVRKAPAGNTNASAS